MCLATVEKVLLDTTCHRPPSTARMMFEAILGSGRGHTGNEWPEVALAVVPYVMGSGGLLAAGVGVYVLRGMYSWVCILVRME